MLKTLAAKYRFCSGLLVLLAVLSLGVADVVAIPVSRYHEKLDQIIADIESLIDADETESEYEARFTETIETVRAKLPKTEPVEFEQNTLSADNNWFHTALDDLQRSPPEQRAAMLASLLEALRAVDERVSEFEGAENVADNTAAARQKMQTILARPEYVAGARGPNALTRVIQDFIRWLERLLPKPPEMQPGRARTVSFVVQIVVVVIAFALILYVLRLLFIRFKRPLAAKARKTREPRIVLGERLQPEETATDLLSEAEALARSGDLRAAIRKGYIALLVELGDRNVISLAQHKTNRDYLRSVSNLPQLHSRLNRLTESFERHWYGFAQASPNDWQDFRAGYREALQTGN